MISIKLSELAAELASIEAQAEQVAEVEASGFAPLIDYVAA